MTHFRIRDLNDPDMPSFFDSTRKDYKRVIKELDENGCPIRVETSYEDGIPVKSLTILEVPDEQ